MLKVSVIIPVYNAINFIDQAMESVIENPAVAQIVLVEDGSTDDSFAKCKAWQTKFPDKVKLVVHDENKNLGAAASRNLGILSADYEYLAFLDSDDYFLPDRFSKTEGVFRKYSDADGVYEAIGTHYYDDIGKELHLKRMDEINIHQIPSELTTITRIIAPENLFHDLIVGKCGWFHFNGLTVKKSIFEKSGMLDEQFIVGEDTDLFFRMAITSNLYPGELEKPVAMRGVYDGNGTLSVFTSSRRMKLDNDSNALLWKKYFEFSLTSDFGKKVNRYLLNKHLDYFNDKMIRLPIKKARKLYKGFLFYCLLMNNPVLIKKIW